MQKADEKQQRHRSDAGRVKNENSYPKVFIRKKCNNNDNSSKQLNKEEVSCKEASRKKFRC